MRLRFVRPVADALAAAGLLDEYHVWVYPVIKGEGEPLFRRESAGTLELLGATTFSTGALALTYRPLTSPSA
ncbi:hypothetical protein Skr01_07320 [Sphaerisporangium krabiense]|uniref:Dihydrofolate reductase n=1 Tax=Sphaerisporangium krabiense TaxID=763782 RepID=A0A7W9DUF7_9ACTN|nr:dihydrofolate reductase family protein [Sphaerisporangium krabiense]MBB5631716.1 dihydrofolate reductase [Sphaerisporangium krabiense]GII60647.1 hypothetical protein Skr01_07320 [Sphaerisporangium krabiense]